MKLLAFLDELYYPHVMGGYVSRSPSAKFFRYLRSRFRDITLMVPVGKPVGGALSDWAVSTVEERLQVVPLTEWSSQLEFVTKSPALVGRLQEVIQDAVSSHDVVWIRMPSLAGILVHREARRYRRPVLLHTAANERTAWRAERSPQMRILKRVLGLALYTVSIHMYRQAGVLATGLELFHMYRQKSLVIANFVDSLVGQEDFVSPATVEKKIASRISPLTVLYVGRLIESKGILELAQAVGQLQSDGVRLRLKVIGYGTTSLVDRVARLVERGSLDFVGYVPHGPRLLEEYRSADVFVLPTAQWPEGLPRVILEAMACGVPVIATDIGGVKGVIVHGESGLLVRPGSVDDLVKALRTLATNPELRGHLARRALQQAWEYSAQSQANVVFRVLDALTGAGGGKGARGIGFEQGP